MNTEFLYKTIICDVLNECKIHNHELTTEEIEKIAAKRTLEKLDKLEVLNNE